MISRVRTVLPPPRRAPTASASTPRRPPPAPGSPTPSTPGHPPRCWCAPWSAARRSPTPRSGGSRSTCSGPIPAGEVTVRAGGRATGPLRRAAGRRAGRRWPGRPAGAGVAARRRRHRGRRDEPGRRRRCPAAAARRGPPAHRPPAGVAPRLPRRAGVALAHGLAGRSRARHGVGPSAGAARRRRGAVTAAAADAGGRLGQRRRRPARHPRVALRQHRAHHPPAPAARRRVDGRRRAHDRSAPRAWAPWRACCSTSTVTIGRSAQCLTVRRR